MKPFNQQITVIKKMIQGKKKVDQLNEETDKHTRAIYWLEQAELKVTSA
jgi:hypothetical protein